MQIVATEALQCPTLLLNGFGGHRIEGIGDKHVPWVHNVRNTDAIAAIDDEDCMRVLRLLNEEEGKGLLADAGVPADTVDLLPLLGISSICNLLSAIKTARYFELSKKDIILTVFTDSADMYRSRLSELAAARGAYNIRQAVMDLEGPLHHQRTDFFKELGYHDRKAIHNLKYYTWVEQQGKTTEELNAQWAPEYWTELFEEEPTRIDALIEEFNRGIGLS